MRLLMHDMDAAGSASPFEQALDEVLADGEADVACPFIHLSVLATRLERLNRWRVLTDVEAWLAITPRQAARTRLRDWWLANRTRVRNLPGLHAKVAVGRRAAMLGSANLTAKGLYGRVEAGVLTDDPAAVRRLSAWYDDLWGRSYPLDETDLNWVMAVPPPTKSAAATARRPASLGTNPVRRRREPNQPDGQPANSQEQSLVDRLSIAPSLKWCDRFLNWVAAVLDIVGLSHDDPRLKGSVTRAGELNVSLNHRYVLATGRHRDGRVWLMVRLADLARIQELLPTAEHDQDFFEHGRSLRTAVRVPFPPPPDVEGELRGLWEGAIVDEAHARTSTAGRRADNPSLFRAATDPAYRSKVLAAVAARMDERERPGSTT